MNINSMLHRLKEDILNRFNQKHGQIYIQNVVHAFLSIEHHEIQGQLLKFIGPFVKVLDVFVERHPKTTQKVWNLRLRRSRTASTASDLMTSFYQAIFMMLKRTSKSAMESYKLKGTLVTQKTTHWVSLRQDCDFCTGDQFMGTVNLGNNSIISFPTHIFCSIWIARLLQYSKRFTDGKRDNSEEQWGGSLQDREVRAVI